MFFKRASSVEKQLLNFRNVSVSHCFRNSSLTITWNNLGLSDCKCIKRNLEFREKGTKETFFYKRSAKYSSQIDVMAERCHKCIRTR